MYDCIMVVVLWAFVFASGLAAAYAQYNPNYPAWKSDVLQVLLVWGCLNVGFFVWFRYQYKRMKKLRVLDKMIAQAPTAQSDRRPCPRCGESIPRAAKVCRFCGLVVA